jgi:hypothetical protein
LVTETDVLRCIADEKCIEILTIIHQSNALSIPTLRLTRKQYYSRLRNAITYGLVLKKNGRYQMTSFGKVVFYWYLILKKVISNEYWKLAAIDILNSSGVSDSDRIKITNSLIEDEEVRRFLLTSIQK